MSRMWMILHVILVASALQGCGNSAELTSHWSGSAIVIDGKADEWSSALMPIENTPVALALRNDQDYLYLCMRSSDRQFGRQLVGAGMTVWFEPKEGDRIGIHYPLGMAGMEMSGRMEPPEGAMPGGERREGGLPDGEPPDQRKTGILPEVVRELEILGPGGKTIDRIPTIQAPGIEVRLGQSAGTYVYELKVPLKKTAGHPYAVAAASGSVVGVNFETGISDRPPKGRGGKQSGQGGEGGGGFPGGNGPGGMGPAPGGVGPIDGGSDAGGPSGGGMPGGGMGRGRGGARGGQGGPGASRSEPKQFELETEVTLAPIPGLSQN